MFCAQCGIALGASDRFCSKCGTAVFSSHEESTAQPSAPDPSPAAVVVASSFQDPTKLTQWLKYLLYASIVINAIALFSGVLQYQLLSGFKLGVYSSSALATAAAESNDKRQQVIGLFQVGIYIITAILFAIWIYRANFNARQLGAQGMKFSPGWSIGYYFIPILGLWKPYQAMREIWQASKNPVLWVTVERGSVLPWWWFLFLADCILGQAVFRTSLKAKEFNELIISTGITIASDLVSIPATIIALVLVKQIYEMQKSNALQHIGSSLTQRLPERDSKSLSQAQPAVARTSRSPDAYPSAGSKAKDDVAPVPVSPRNVKLMLPAMLIGLVLTGIALTFLLLDAISNHNPKVAHLLSQPAQIAIPPPASVPTKTINFDYVAARKAGASNGQILDYFNKEGYLNFDLAAARSAGYTDDQIIKALEWGAN